MATTRTTSEVCGLAGHRPYTEWVQRLLLKPVCSCAIRFIDPTYETPSMDCLMLPLLATANLNVTQSYAPNMVVTFQVDPSVG